MTARGWKTIDGVVFGSAILLVATSLGAEDWKSAGAAAVVVLGIVAYRRGWIRRFGR